MARGPRWPPSDSGGRAVQVKKQLPWGTALGMIRSMDFTVRAYDPADEGSWLRCRVLSFLGTAYFDNVVASKPVHPRPFAELVAVEDDTVVGALDLAVAGDLATIETIAVHPDHQHRGIGTALFDEARRQAIALGALTIDAWTRDDEPTLRWYRSRGFVESDHYLHVYANHSADADEPARAVDGHHPGLLPVTAFLHSPLDLEEEMRKNFSRVHICRRFAQPL
jgi:ribosomal protein S18 acetylase RimI-like enzyme